MPKSKEYISESEDSDDEPTKGKQKSSGAKNEESSDESDYQPTKNKKRSSAKKNEESSEESDYEPSKKKKKPSSKQEKKPTNAGEVSFQLSKNRWVSVSEFRGSVYVNIREYYEADGQMKPGRKGISLNKEQWKNLKNHMKSIDAALKDSH